jgi:hypothetical protein
MVEHTHRQVRTALVLAVVVLALAGCSRTTTTGVGSFYCTSAIGSHPQFVLTGGPTFTASPHAGGFLRASLPIESVETGPFDFVQWDVLDLLLTVEPDWLTWFTTGTNPTMGTDTNVVEIHIYGNEPAGDYGLRLSGRAYAGSVLEGTPTLVGECFQPFVLRIN